MGRPVPIAYGELEFPPDFLFPMLLPLSIAALFIEILYITITEVTLTDCIMNLLWF